MAMVIHIGDQEIGKVIMIDDKIYVLEDSGQ